MREKEQKRDYYRSATDKWQKTAAERHRKKNLQNSLSLSLGKFAYEKRKKN